jgi:hypothetical protein
LEQLLKNYVKPCILRFQTVKTEIEHYIQSGPDNEKNETSLLKFLQLVYLFNLAGEPLNPNLFKSLLNAKIIPTYIHDTAPPSPLTILHSYPSIKNLISNPLTQCSTNFTVHDCVRYSTMLHEKLQRSKFSMFAHPNNVENFFKSENQWLEILGKILHTLTFC